MKAQCETGGQCLKSDIIRIVSQGFERAFGSSAHKRDGCMPDFSEIVEWVAGEVIDAIGNRRYITVSGGSLNNRERQIALMITQGMTTKEIARILHLSSRTVDTHRYNIRKKLGLRLGDSLSTALRNNGFVQSESYTLSQQQ